jgi:hypothetical protein
MAESHFDEWIAQRYHLLWPELFEPSVVQPAVEVLADLAGTGSALEFGIGTGRIAIPLSQGAYAYKELSSLLRWLRSYLPSTTRRTSTSPSVTLLQRKSTDLDLMARMTGLILVHRWSGWDRKAFTGDSRQPRLGLAEGRLVTAPAGNSSRKRGR